MESELYRLQDEVKNAVEKYTWNRFFQRTPDGKNLRFGSNNCNVFLRAGDQSLGHFGYETLVTFDPGNSDKIFPIVCRISPSLSSPIAVVIIPTKILEDFRIGCDFGIPFKTTDLQTMIDKATPGKNPYIKPLNGGWLTFKSADVRTMPPNNATDPYSNDARVSMRNLRSSFEGVPQFVNNKYINGEYILIRNDMKNKLGRPAKLIIEDKNN